MKMASVELSKADHDELCCSYAALMLHDDGCDITAERLTQVITATGNSVEAYWPTLFAKALQSAKVEDLLSNVAAAAGSGGGGGGAAAGPADHAAAIEEEKKEEVEDVDMGGLFGDDDEY